jgi:hypothetical protein
MAICWHCEKRFDDGGTGVDICPKCDDDLEHFVGDYNDLHPDETEEEFWEHEDHMD